MSTAPRFVPWIGNETPPRSERERKLEKLRGRKRRRNSKEGKERERENGLQHLFGLKTGQKFSFETRICALCPFSVRKSGEGSAKRVDINSDEGESRVFGSLRQYYYY